MLGLPCDWFGKQSKIGDMTTRAGSAGLLTGVLITMIIFPLFTAWQDANLHGELVSATLSAWIAAAAAFVLTCGGSFLAARGSKSSHPGRCAALGGLAGAIVFCLWGAAAAGMVGPMSLFGMAAKQVICQDPQVEIIRETVSQTTAIFLVLFLGGTSVGAFVGWLTCLRPRIQMDTFDKSGPQMALNISITAVPASIVAAMLAAAIFPRLADFAGRQTSESICARSIMDMPLAVSLLLHLISQFALTLVIPHEALQAENLCGMDEVKMAAWVGIGASPVIFLLLFLIEPDFLSNRLVVTALLITAGMSACSLYALFKLILPRRASLPRPPKGWQQAQASLFGTIVNSQSSHLVLLCIGCGLAMVMPVYASVLSVLINLVNVLAGSTYVFIPEGTWKPFLNQSLASIGLFTASIFTLTTIYLFYMNLGRWFIKWNSHRTS